MPERPSGTTKPADMRYSLRIGQFMHFIRIPDPDLIPRLLKEFPEFQSRWEEHLAYWKDETPGAYLDMAEFVHFVVEDLYQKEQTERLRDAFALMEALFANGNETTKAFLAWGFFETLQNFASNQPCGSKVFEPFLGPMSRQVWLDIEELWQGKSSLMDVIRAERKSQQE